MGIRATEQAARASQSALGAGLRAEANVDFSGNDVAHRGAKQVELLAELSDLRTGANFVERPQQRRN